MGKTIRCKTDVVVWVEELELGRFQERPFQAAEDKRATALWKDAAPCFSFPICISMPKNFAPDLNHSFAKTSTNVANWAQRFRFGKMENQLLIFTADFATRVVRNRGKPIRSCWSGLQRRDLAARVYCMCWNDRRLSSTGASRNFGPSLARQTKIRSHSGNCFRIRPAFALWISALTCSIMTE